MLAVLQLTGKEGTCVYTTFAVEGHADEVGGPAYNYGLSMCRAEAVVAWLVEEGVDAERLVAVAAGEALADGPGSRRVSFLVLIWNEEVEVEEPFD